MVEAGHLSMESLDTPAMRQYRVFKEQYPDCVLFFRMGDFYEMFFEDAKLASKVLGVALTQRTAGVPMAGVPYHSVEGYLRRMILAGHRVVVCEQVEEAGQGKGVIRREVTRVITPGTLTDDSLLEEGRENPLAAVMFHDDEKASAAWAELSTGSFRIATFETKELADELARVRPGELLYVETANREAPARVRELIIAVGCAAAGRPAWQFRQGEANEILRKQFGVATLAGFGLRDDDPALGAASAVVHYLLETQCATGEQGEAAGRKLGHLQAPRRFDRAGFLVIDQTSLRSLEVEQTIRTGGTEGSLLDVLRDCRTAMGKRTLRQWLCYPLCKKEAIEQRQRVVGAMVEDERLLGEMGVVLDGVQDVERILGRISVGRALPRDLTALGQSVSQAGRLSGVLADRPATGKYCERLTGVAAVLEGLAAEVLRACVDSPPAHLREGGLFRDGYDARLDECRALQRDSNEWLAAYQKSLIEETGIASLKVGFNKVFGFYIELTASQREKAPAGWSRKQTLKNAERFITQELKEYEGKVLTAEQRAVAREQELFAGLCEEARGGLAEVREFAAVVAELDVLACFARRAKRRRYVRPRIVEEPVLMIRGGRHPVLDEILADRFVPNDVALGGRDGDVGLGGDDGEGEGSVAAGAGGQGRATLALITGPNMAGKSTYIRQAALIALLAHTGSFVPAEEAVVGLCDRIFTRIGASDELHAGQSTFMVEMTETANICRHASKASLVILDEIGRGTSTLDGLSLAWAIAEHLAERRCRTLFATHYHELTELSERFENITNLNVAVREWADQIVFLHRIVPGATDKSYGIHVAKIAGLPGGVVARAKELLGQLEVNHHSTEGMARPRRNGGGRAGGRPQMSLFTQYLEHPVVVEVRKLDLAGVSPLEAFDRLRRLQELTHDLRGGGEGGIEAGDRAVGVDAGGGKR